MKQNIRYQLGLAALWLAFTVPAQGAPQPEDLAQVRLATAPYHQVESVLRAGYAPTAGLTHCIERPGVGAMGYHFFSQQLIADAVVTPLQPEALVYAPGPNGQLQLAAVEYIVPIQAWHAAGNIEPPSVLGVPMHPGPNPALGWYILHFWVWRHNPAGMAEDWNPAITCQ
jgi:hypothetical protein